MRRARLVLGILLAAGRTCALDGISFTQTSLITEQREPRPAHVLLHWGAVSGADALAVLLTSVPFVALFAAPQPPQTEGKVSMGARTHLRLGPAQADSSTWALGSGKN